MSQTGKTKNAQGPGTVSTYRRFGNTGNYLQICVPGTGYPNLKTLIKALIFKSIWGMGISPSTTSAERINLVFIYGIALTLIRDRITVL